MTDNPLLAPAGPGVLPAFDRIKPEHAEPAVDAVLAHNRAELEKLLEAGAAPAWESLIEPLEDMGDRLGRAWGPVSHLFGVCATADWRKAYNAGLPKVTEYGLELSQNQALFEDLPEAAKSRAGYAAFPPARRKVVEDALRDFRLSGIALPPKERARFKEIALRLSELQTRFEENLMDSVQAWNKPVSDQSLLDGMTEQGLAQAAERARAKDLLEG